MHAAKSHLITSVLIGGCIIMVGFAIRASFGVFQIPIAEQFGWPRAEFSLAIAWKFGDRKAIILGASLHAPGLILSSFATDPGVHQFLEILVGFGIAGTGFGVILAVVGRAASNANRSMALAITTAAGSAGQVIGAPVADLLLGFVPWTSVFILFAGAILLALFALPMMRAPAMASKAELEESMAAILLKAFRDPSCTLIFLGFFSCGYQLAFVTAHFQAFVTECAARCMTFMAAVRWSGGSALVSARSRLWCIYRSTRSRWGRGWQFRAAGVTGASSHAPSAVLPQ